MSKRIVYAEDDNISLTYEVLNDCLFVHVVLFNFNKHVLERLKTAWEYMKADAYMDGWEMIFTYTQDPRIVNLIGGAEELGRDNPEVSKTGMRMYKWDLTHSLL